MIEEDNKSSHSKELNEIWSLFAEESGQALNQIEECLLHLEKKPTDSERVSVLFRAMHTFKGMAGMMGLSVIEALGHSAEDVIGLVRDEGVTPDREMIDLLLATLDQARGMLAHALVYRQDVDPTGVEQTLTRLRAMFAKYNNPFEPSSLNSVQEADNFLENPEPVDIGPITEMSEISVEQIDPATDPLYVNIFLEVAQEQVSRINTASSALFDGSETAVTDIEAAVDELRYAAQQMKYERLFEVLDELIRIVREPNHGLSNVRYKEAELRLFEELTIIQETSSPQTKKEQTGISFAWLFRQWHADRVFSDLTRLGELMEDLKELISQDMFSGSKIKKEADLAAQTTSLLQSIYHSCIFYKLELAAHLTLAFEDLYARISQAEMTSNLTLVELTQSFIVQLGQTMGIIREGETPKFFDWETMIKQTEEILYLCTEGQAEQVTRDVLDLLNLPQGFKEVITPENLREISHALQTGQHFYTVLADINQNEAVGLAFLEWSKLDAIHLITSITVLRDTSSLFRFLLATNQSEAEFATSFKQIDPTGQFISWEACVLREELDLRGATNKLLTEEPKRREKLGKEQQTAIDKDVMASFMGLLGKLLAAHGMLSKVTEKLAQNQLTENLSRWQRQANGNQVSVWQEVQKVAEGLAEDSRALTQIEAEIGAGLNELYETALTLRMQPIAEILNPLSHYTADIARPQGKNIQLEIFGAEIALDPNTLNILDDSLRCLVRFAVMYSIETREQRQSLGKVPVGHVAVRAVKRDSRIQITIEDDGRGLDEVIVINRARELGWTQADNAPIETLIHWVLREGFGSIYKDGESDLASMQAELHRHNGQLVLMPRAEGGLRFELSLPLSMALLYGMVVRTGPVHYVVPIEVINRIVKPVESEIVYSSAEGGGAMLCLGEKIIPIHHLGNTTNYGKIGENLLLVVECGEQPVALTVEELIGEQQVLIQPLQGYIAAIRGISGCALLGNGEVGMILDLNQMVIS